MSRRLWTRLVLPLMALAGASLVVNHRWPAGGFFVNLATELLGIIVTVAYVDWVVRKHEADLWHGADSRIKDRLKRFGTAEITTIRVCLGYGVDILEQSEILSGDVSRGEREVLRVARHVLMPSVRARLDTLDQAGWKRLADQLRDLWREAERLIDRFGPRLEPRQLEVLLDTQQSLQEALSFVQVFPDLAGVPTDKLPNSKTPPELLKGQGYDATAAHIRALLGHAERLHGR